MYAHAAAQSNGAEVATAAEAQANDLLEGDLLTLSQHLTVARRCHDYVSSLTQESAPAAAEQQQRVLKQQLSQQPHLQQQSQLRCASLPLHHDTKYTLSKSSH